MKAGADPGLDRFACRDDWAYAVNLLETVTWLAGAPDYLDDLKHEVQACRLFEASAGSSQALYDWLVPVMAYQGISDAVAADYMANHETPAWASIAAGVDDACCPLMASYWHFHGCRYRKGGHTCAAPHLIDACPLPRHDFRNGNLNQLAYSFFLFIRDIAGGDLIGWIDARLAEAAGGPSHDQLARMRAAIIGPLSGVHGIADKVIGVALADLMVVGAARNPLWGELGGALIAIDTLVHNFLHRTGILRRAHAAHQYGPACYGPNGCAALLSALAASIDARQFNSAFPQYFPRYIQKAVWAYCAAEGLDVCNGRRINDNGPCGYRECRLYFACDRVALRKGSGHAAEERSP